MVTHPVDKLKIEWPDEKRDVRRSTLDVCFLSSGRSQQPHRNLPLFPDLHAEILGPLLLDASVLHSGLFGNTVKTVIDRFQVAKKQFMQVTFMQFLLYLAEFK